MLYVSTKHLSNSGSVQVSTTVTCVHIRKVYEGLDHEQAAHQFAKEMGWNIKQLSFCTWEVIA